MTTKCNRCKVARDDSFFTKGTKTLVTCALCRKQRRDYYNGESVGFANKIIKHVEIDGEPAKACTKCNIVKTLDNYNKAVGKSSDDLKAVCKKCLKLYAQTEDGKKKQAIRAKRYYDKNAALINQKGKEWRQNNRERSNKRQNEYRKKKYAEDPNFKIRCSLRSRVYSVLMNQRVEKTAKTRELIGCTVQEVMDHLESLFTEGMSWENYGEWHIDHIKPCAKFNLTNVEEQRKCFNYKNLQPLWAEENILKSDKWTDQDEIRWMMFNCYKEE